MAHRRQTNLPVRVSEARRAITRRGFFAALEEVEIWFKRPSSVSSLIDAVLPVFGNSPLHTLKPSDWNLERARTLADHDRVFARTLDDWLSEKNLRVDWVRDVALFTLAVSHHRPSAPLGWRIPPIPGANIRKPPPFTFAAPGWQPDWESRGAATERIRTDFGDALSDYVDTVAAERVAPGWHGVKNRAKEERELQWVAVKQVYGWSTREIARQWNVGKADRAGGTGRAHVARTIQYWQQIIVLSP